MVRREWISGLPVCHLQALIFHSARHSHTAHINGFIFSICLCRTPLISVPGPVAAKLGGTVSETAVSLGFVPCMSSTTYPASCHFSVTPSQPNDSSFFPHNEVSAQGNVLRMFTERLTSVGENQYFCACGLPRYAYYFHPHIACLFRICITSAMDYLQPSKCVFASWGLRLSG